MGKVLFCVDSYFQLILSLNLRKKIYKEYEADIIIYNSIPSALKIFDILCQKKNFRNVYVANSSLTRCGKKYSFWEKFPKYWVYLLSMIFPSVVLKKIIGNPIRESYDVMIFNSYGALPECIFNNCIRINPNLQCKRIEDGFVSYYTIFGSKKGFARNLIESFFSLCFGRKKIESHINACYFMEPDLVIADLPYKIEQSPKFCREDSDIITLLNEIFQYKNDIRLEGKDLFLFEDGTLFFDGNNEEVEIASRLSKIISKDRILVKMHPRRNENRYSDIGIDVMEKSNVPWELIQLNKNFSNKIFVTVASSVAFSSDVYFGDNCIKILLYKCLKTPPSIISSDFERYVSLYKRKFGDESLFIPNTYEELENIIQTIKL